MHLFYSTVFFLFSTFVGVFSNVVLNTPPFNWDKTIDYKAYEEYVAWQAAYKPQHLFAVCGSSEMMELTPEERVKCAGLAVKNSNGVPVYATGNIAVDYNDQVEEMKKQAAEEAFNPYKEAKRTGKSVQEVIALHEKEVAKKEAKEAKKAAKDEDDEYEWIDINTYRVGARRPVKATESTFVAKKKEEAAARRAEEREAKQAKKRNVKKGKGKRK